jgi:hypothetical protein
MKLLIALDLLADVSGGRKSPVGVGYRSMWDNGDRLSDGQVHYHDAPIVSLNPDPLHPGHSASAFIEAVDAAGWMHVRPGATLLMTEGRRTVGRATVVEVT